MVEKAPDGRVKHGFRTVLGSLFVETDGAAVTRLGWGKAAPYGDPLALEAERQLGAYFRQELQAFDLPFDHGLTGLSAQVLEVMQAIPFGETRTYGDIAKELNAPAQAVGQACGANPIPILIPCHRVLGANSLGGYSGAGGIETKVDLLKHEGAAGLLI